jgi:glycosyltransferase involved in cell wall biosynthesis
MHNPVVWVACPTACDIALKFKKQRLVYQRTDRFEAYPDVDINLIQQYDRELKANSDLTIFVNDKLYELEREQCKKAIYLDHGVDYDVFASAELNQDKPADIAKIPKPIVGYFGLLDAHKLNINFTKSLVELMPNVSFVFIGITTPQFAQLAKKENVWLLGQKPYEQIPHYGKCFDAAIFPANHNKWIKACNPIKLKEYLALGKPVISTSFPELREYSDVVYQANTPEKFARCLEKALAENSAERIAARRKKVQSATWASKAQLVMNELFVDNDN